MVLLFSQLCVYDGPSSQDTMIMTQGKMINHTMIMAQPSMTHFPRYVESVTLSMNLATSPSLQIVRIRT